MKVNVPGSILATSISLGAIVNAQLPHDALAADLPGEMSQTGDAAATPNVASVIDGTDEFYVTVEDVPLEIEWDRAAEKRFQALAVKEATETLSGSELVELEGLTIARRKHTVPPISAEEMLEELRQWRRVSRVFEALDRYVEEIGIKRTTAAHRS